MASAAALRSVRNLTGGGCNSLAAGIGNVTAGKESVRFSKMKHPKFLELPKACSVLGAPMTYGQPYYGLDRGPEALREHELHEWLKRLDWRVRDLGNLTFKPPTGEDPEYEGPGNCRQAFAVSQACEKIWKRTRDQAEKGNFVLTLGGDHSIGLGTVSGAITARPNVGCIWVDAHADINTPEISSSGNMHGMPLSFVTQLGDYRTVPGMDWMKDVPRLDPSTQLVYIGLRDVDAGERRIIKEQGIKAFTMYHVDKYGIGKVMEMALDHLGERPLHMSYDIDACDPLIAPSTGTAVRGGLTYREAHFVAEAIAETNQLVSLDLVEVNPVLEGSENDEMSLDGETTVEMALNLIASCMGKSIM